MQVEPGPHRVGRAHAALQADDPGRAHRLALALSSCAEDAQRPRRDGAADDAGPTLTQCRDILGQDAFAALGWEALGDAALDESTCSRTGSGGELTLERRPVRAGSTQEVPAAADVAFEERCAKLGGLREEPAGEMVDWLGEVPACAWTPEAVTSHLLLVRWSDHVVTEARVVPTADVAPAAARETLNGGVVGVPLVDAPKVSTASAH